jgi:hypothetical protein
MDTLNPLYKTVRAVVEGYAVPAEGADCYLAESEDHSLFTVIDLYTVQGKRHANAGLVVRVEGDQVIIERDMNNKMLVDALLQAGVPREQIILAYAGELLPVTQPR